MSLFAVIPVFAGPLQILLMLLPGLLLLGAATLLKLLRPPLWQAILAIAWRQKWQLLGLAVCSAGLIWATREAVARLRRSEPRWEATAADWPTARGGAARLGVTASGQIPASGGWTYRTNDAMFLASPAVRGNRIYVPFARLGMLRNRGAICCFDADSGELSWTAAPWNYAPTFSSPVIVGSRLYCGEGLHDTKQARLVCLDLRPGREGEVIWTHACASHVECTPVVADSRVYVATGEDGIYCLDQAPDARGHARVHWHRPARDYPDAETALAVSAGRVYVGLGFQGQALCVLDATTGEELKRIELPHPAFGPPSFAAGKLYLGTGNGTYTRTGSNGAVVCIDLQTLAIDWQFDVSGAVMGSVASVGEELYFASQNGRIYCLDGTGRLISSWNSFAAIHASPAVTENHVFIVNSDGVLFALSRRTLQPEYEHVLGPPGLYVSSPAVARGRVYVGSEFGFHAVALPSATSDGWVARSAE